METQNNEMIRVFKAFADESRISILKLLSEGEACAGALLRDLPLTQPTLSHHMKVLCECGIVKSRKEGTWVYYTIDPGIRNRIDGYIDSITGEAGKA